MLSTYYSEGMFMTKTTHRRNIIRALIVIGLSVTALIFAVLSYTAHEINDISDSVLRLHIIANSDSAEDQELKLKVRDEVIKSCGPIFSDCKSLSEAKLTASENLARINDTVNRVIAENGYSYTSSCFIGSCGFPTKRYNNATGGTFSLPRGEYSALNIRLGDAAGHNWWCVMYPPLCLTNGVVSADESADSTLRENLSASEYDLITGSDRADVKVRFKIAELLGAYN